LGVGALRYLPQMPRVLLLALLAMGCATAKPTATADSAPPAKHFSMKGYQMAILRKGPKWSGANTPEIAKLLQGHMANIKRLSGSGKLLIAGPFDIPEDAPPETPVGIFIFDVESTAEAQALVATDPTIKAGHFAAELLPWYGPAGLTYDGREEEMAKNRAERAH
jgi:uncharacterized protein YciI